MKFMFTPFFLFFFWLFEFFLSEVVNTINKYCVLDAVLIKSLGFLFKLK